MKQAMRYMTALAMITILSAMGPGRRGELPDINPPSPAEVDAAQARTPPAKRPGLVIQTLNATEIAREDLLWKKRAVVVFDDTPDSPSFQRQMRSLTDRAGELAMRDVIVIIDTDPQQGSAWRKWLNPHGFQLVIIDKDGQVKQRKPAPWDAREISRAIDKFPLRREEIGRASVLP